MKLKMTPLVLAFLLVGALALPSYPASSINEQRSMNYKTTGNQNLSSPSSSHISVHQERVSGAYATHASNQNHNTLIDNPEHNNIYNTRDSYYVSRRIFDTDSKNQDKQEVSRIGYIKATPQAKQMTYRPYYQFPSQYHQNNILSTNLSANLNSSIKTGTEMLSNTESVGKLRDSYLKEIPTAINSAQSNSLRNLQDTYLQGSANMEHATEHSLDGSKNIYLHGNSFSMKPFAQSNPIDDLNDSYLQGSSSGQEHSAISNSVYDLNDSYLQGSLPGMEHSGQSGFVDDLSDSYLQGSSAGLEHSIDGVQNSYLQGNTIGLTNSAISNSVDDLNDSYLQGSSTGTVHSAQSNSLDDSNDSYLQGSLKGIDHPAQSNLQDSYLQGNVAEESSSNDMKHNYLKGISVAKTPYLDPDSLSSLQDSYVQGSNAMDLPLTQSNAYGDLQDSSLQGNLAGDSFDQGGLGLESEPQGSVSDTMQVDSVPYSFDQQNNYTTFSQSNGDEYHPVSKPIMPPVPIDYQTPPPMPTLSATNNKPSSTPLAVTYSTTALYEYLVPPPTPQPTQQAPPPMSSASNTSPTALPLQTLETSVSYEYPPPPFPSPVKSVPYSYEPPPSPLPPLPVAYGYPVPPPPTLTSAPYYYNPPPVPPSKQYLPAPSPPTTTPIPTTELVPYNIGAKIWFIPLIFSGYFAIYITALILKEVLKHKIFFPDNLLAATISNSRRGHSSNLDQLSTIVSRAIATAVTKYVS